MSFESDLKSLVLKFLGGLSTSLRPPIYLVKVEQIDMGFRVTFAFPPLGAKDVVTRHVQLLRAGEIVIDVQEPKDTFVYPVVVDEGIEYTLRLSDKDDAGNEAVDALEFTWTQVDNTPPVMTGALSVSKVVELNPDGTEEEVPVTGTIQKPKL